MKTLSNILLPLLLILLLPSCRQQRDRNGILTESAMAEVLYDYQLAIAMASQDNKDERLAETEYRYTQAVFAKHGITAHDYDISLAHYARDPKKLLEITQKVSERLTGEVQSTQSALASNAADGDTSDTINVWKHRPAILLNANGRNHVQFSIPGRVVRPCERLLFGMSSAWLYREGSKSGVLSVAVVYDNDSTDTHIESIHEYERAQGLTIDINPKRHIKRLDVDIYQSARWQKHVQMLVVNDLSLWCIKKQKAKPHPSETDTQDADTLQSADAPADSASLGSEAPGTDRRTRPSRSNP